MIEEGKKAPTFKLSDQNGKVHSLKDYLGKKVVLYFYPKDNTPGCTTEACSFRDEFPTFKKNNTVILGVSADPVKSHKNFSDKFGLPFPLLSDVSKEMIENYGVWKEKSMYGKKYEGIERTTVIIDEMGAVKKIFSKVKVKEHTEEVLKALK
ncbi:MAG: thioredoxin-dependent thiol peroxidase [Ignavibacteria bacterium CG22_combo_CG10-13_8_21_14_all_37_15]|nr:thioredoxin-dependent thiol peroxidase [Ignavibacteria bacterium]OIO14173.1 MAG: peroxiredoxin [Ignavibacteria bacterium CG1_02_37_35]PIP79193.1 MAG: thioredoxin-dependent thiol peroxidase [Ignavibacteria bacterium CG22_combo_CG10-13_8_21_14_all_37_15]PIX93742.1 MAG: thioredoxin-dependent thiol peroxidase [Ignavibacteria bacterium CG_4_10_14_3_um_filter_37_18]PJC59882.1 MAG: thioredoxin-dependent thiol peroxidase [Ignavibacteria bacterium CG_4_9_14_0_2_um_filter_37_13]